jgi:hypothetical protein
VVSNGHFMQRFGPISLIWTGDYPRRNTITPLEETLAQLESLGSEFEQAWQNDLRVFRMFIMETTSTGSVPILESLNGHSLAHLYQSSILKFEAFTCLHFATNILTNVLFGRINNKERMFYAQNIDIRPNHHPFR